MIGQLSPMFVSEPRKWCVIVCKHFQILTESRVVSSGRPVSAPQLTWDFHNGLFMMGWGMEWKLFYQSPVSIHLVGQ